MNEDYGEMLPPHIPSGVDYTKLSPTEVAIESIKVSVHEWIEKYHPRYGDSNLLVTDPTDKHQLLQWRDGVLGRILHQFIGSGSHLDEKIIEKAIAEEMHEYFFEDPWYFDYLLEVLPSTR